MSAVGGVGATGGLVGVADDGIFIWGMGGGPDRSWAKTGGEVTGGEGTDFESS